MADDEWLITVALDPDHRKYDDCCRSGTFFARVGTLYGTPTFRECNDCPHLASPQPAQDGVRASSHPPPDPRMI